MKPSPALAPAASPPRMSAARRRGVLAKEQWRSRADVAGLATALESFGTDPPSDCAALGARLQPWLADGAWLDAFVEECCATMRADAFAAFPFRPVGGRAVQGLALLQTENADVSLCWVDALTLPHAQGSSVIFSSTLSVVKVLRAAELTVQAHRLGQPAAAHPALRTDPPRTLSDGELLSLDNRWQSLTMLHAEGDAVVLRISVRLPDKAPQRGFDAATGRLTATALADDNVSRMLPLLSVARLAGCARQAAPMLANLASHPDPVLRWAAFREWLVADTRAAVAALPALAADDPDQQVRAAAAATLAVLTVREPALCPA